VSIHDWPVLAAAGAVVKVPLPVRPLTQAARPSTLSGSGSPEAASIWPEVPW
jgi:hypothetical protein